MAGAAPAAARVDLLVGAPSGRPLRPPHPSARSLPRAQVGLWHQLLGSAPVAAHGGAISDDRGSSLNLAVEAARIAAAARAAPTIGKRPPNVGFALAIGQLLHAAATGEQLGAGVEPPADASPASGGGGGGSPPPAGGGEGSPADGGGDGAAAAAAAAGAADAASDPLAGDNPLREKPLPPGFGMPRIPSASSIPLAASGAAVSDLPAEDDEGWERQLLAQLATEGARSLLGRRPGLAEQ